MLGGSVLGVGLLAAGGNPAAAPLRGETVKIIATGLMLPESPVPLSNGDVLVVEVLGGRLTRVSPDGRLSMVADLGGGPNGAAIGPDGKVYICNNGGVTSTPDENGVQRTLGIATPGGVGRIERVDPANGRSEVLFTQIDGHQLRSPNDLVFDSRGGFWFSDMGKATQDYQERGSVYYVAPGLASAFRAIHPIDGCNGIGLSPDEKTLYISQTFTGEVVAFDISSEEIPVRKGPIGRAGPGVHIDGLRVQANGDVCVASIGQGGILSFSAGGGVGQFTPLPDPLVTSLALGGADRRTLYATLAWTGRLAAIDWIATGKANAFSI